MDRPVGEKPEVRFARRYPVAPEKVWRAWTDPQALSAWFGPGVDNSVAQAQLDVRPGGTYRIRFHTPDGEEHEVCGQYEVVEPLRKLVFSWAWRSTPERVSRVTVSLQPVPGGTELELLHERFFDAAAGANHRRGWTASFEKLDRWLTSGDRRSGSDRRD
jgi:uncharacterized protein YndB with AHSA1/START domain